MQYQSTAWQDIMRSGMRSLKNNIPNTLFLESKVLYKKKKINKDKSFHGSQSKY